MLRHRHAIATLVLSLLVVLATACAQGTEEIGAQPGEQQPGAGLGMATGAFADVPVPAGADVTGGPIEVNSAETQSFTVTASSPVEVQDFYTAQLPDLGWEEQSRETAGEAIRSFWLMDDVELQVTTSPDGQDTDLRLQLYPAA